MILPGLNLQILMQVLKLLLELPQGLRVSADPGLVHFPEVPN